MDWTMILIGFSLAVLMGAGLSSLLAQMKPEWSPRRRGFVAALVLPGVTIITTLLGLLWIWSLEDPGGGNMHDLAAAALATLGLGFAVVAFVGGLVGAGVAQRRRVR
jgi:hypothetical protein